MLVPTADGEGSSSGFGAIGTAKAANEGSSDAQESLRAVILLRSLVGVEYTLRGELILNTLQEPR